MNEPFLTATAAPRSEQLNLSTKLAYGAGEVARSTTATIQNFFFLFFLTNAAGLSATLAGTVLLLGNIWDVINHPIIGWMSDRTRSRWGRRRSWMLLGAIPFGIFFLLAWLVPHSQNPTWNQTTLFWYYTTVILLFSTAFAAVALPHSALAAELTPKYEERISLISFQSAASLGASIFALVLAQAIFSVASPSTKYFTLGSVCAVLAVLCIYLCVWGTRTVGTHPAPSHSSASAVSFRSQVGLIFKNRPFLYVMGIYLCSWVTMQVTAALLPYAIVNLMHLKEQDFTQVAIAVQVTAMLMMIVWNAARQWVGKRAIYFMGIPLWIVALLGIAFLQPGQVGWMYGLAVLAGVGSSAALLVPWSMLPDVIDLDELQSGQRREGIFYGLTMQFQKIGVAIALFWVGKSLDWAGFVPTSAGQPAPTQPEAALLVMRLEFGPVPAIVLICSLVLAYFYPITREVHAGILLKLREHNNSVD